MSPLLIKQALQGRVIIVELAETCLEEGRVTKIVSYKEGSALGTPRVRGHLLNFINLFREAI